MTNCTITFVIVAIYVIAIIYLIIQVVKKQK